MSEGDKIPLPKTKILCLHGYRQNRRVFKHRLGALAKLIKIYADLYFIDAPHVIPSLSLESFDESNNDEEKDERSWWYTKDTENIFESSKAVEDCYGFYKSVNELQAFMNENGPFDGLLGFSQGAAFASLIAAMKVKGEFGAEFKFVILISGFKSLCAKHLPYYQVKVTIPSFHVMGEEDEIIHKSRSMDLYTIFDKRTARILTHTGGHYVPANKNIKDYYIDFIKKYSNFQ